MLDIAVGVLKRGNKICLSRRQEHQSHAFHWEFPGGKVHLGESISQALRREFHEELGIQTDFWQPLIEIPWHYETTAVRLHVLVSETFSGEPKGCEGQTVEWFAVHELRHLTFPAANAGILSALQLPQQIMITGDFNNSDEACERFSQGMQQGIKLCQLRFKASQSPAENSAQQQLTQQLLAMAKQKGSQCLLNGQPDKLLEYPQADGLHLPSKHLFEYSSRPIRKDKWLGVSTHNLAEIEQALAIHADFILLSPVKATKSHPGQPSLGWQTFAEWVKEIPIPVFALGGLGTEDTPLAVEKGGQGVAAISAFWMQEGD